MIDDKSKIVISHTGVDKHRTLSMEIKEVDSSSWVGLIEDYAEFLCALGFVIDTEELMVYINNYSRDQTRRVLNEAYGHQDDEY